MHTRIRNLCEKIKSKWNRRNNEQSYIFGPNSYLRSKNKIMFNELSVKNGCKENRWTAMLIVLWKCDSTEVSRPKLPNKNLCHERKFSSKKQRDNKPNLINFKINRSPFVMKISSSEFSYSVNFISVHTFCV